MPTQEHKERVGEFFRSRMADLNLGRRDVEREIAVTYTTAHNWYSGKAVPALEKAGVIAELFRVDKQIVIDILTDANGSIPQNKGRKVDNRPDVMQASNVADARVAELPELGPRDIPNMGVAVGGEDAEFYFNGQIESYVRRPAAIASLHEVYALNVIGTSMWPRYKDGELIYVHKRNPAIGDDVIIQVAADLEGQAPRGFIKFLVSRSGSSVVCGQYNPAEKITYPKDKIVSMHRVIPWHELLGV